MASRTLSLIMVLASHPCGGWIYISLDVGDGIPDGAGSRSPEGVEECPDLPSPVRWRGRLPGEPALEAREVLFVQCPEGDGCRDVVIPFEDLLEGLLGIFRIMARELVHVLVVDVVDIEVGGADLEDVHEG